MFDVTVVIDGKHPWSRTVYNVSLPKIPEHGDEVHYENQSGQEYTGIVQNLRFKSEWVDGRVISKIYVLAE